MLERKRVLFPSVLGRALLVFRGDTELKSRDAAT